MDILKRTQRKLSSLGKYDLSPGIDSVLEHIRVAEEYFDQAQAGDQSTRYSDVIYRTNQAFEGILKETYCVIVGSDSPRKSPYQIEKYLRDNDVLQGRVVQQLGTYRADWRNPSTHNHQLVFTGHEAFLAIVTVSALVDILLDEISKEVIRKQESAQMSNQSVWDFSQNVDKDPNSTVNQVSFIAMKYLDDLRGGGGMPMPRPDVGSVGAFAGYLDALLPDVELQLQPELEGVDGIVYRPDMLVRTETEKVVVVIRNHRRLPFVEASVNGDPIADALYELLDATGIGAGVVVYNVVWTGEESVFGIQVDLGPGGKEVREIYSDEPKL